MTDSQMEAALTKTASAFMIRSRAVVEIIRAFEGAA